MGHSLVDHLDTVTHRELVRYVLRRLVEKDLELIFQAGKKGAIPSRSLLPSPGAVEPRRCPYIGAGRGARGGRCIARGRGPISLLL